MKIGQRVIHRCVTPIAYKDRKWTYRTDDRDVLLMAIVGNWAMVRRPRAVPYVCETKELLTNPTTNAG